ncbi:hypothetical protein NYZ99_04265 [Maribacter litopenaei]|uniref:Uncharacterized protein n=1 Tax=Maribacter litopenaei TaxID=2976127 RepID=A0ABY5YA09_9FLAO|nr:hypothetical protein [Maribacter litopenaei]UWX55671.1 hypothetical protein NYZ99_04265 [Maribacter litopenaei]
MQIPRKAIPTLLCTLAMIILIGFSYLNESIFMDQILICAFIIGLTTLVHSMGSIKGSEKNKEQVKEKL